MSKYLELFKGSFNDSINEKTKLENKPYIGYSLAEGKMAYTVVPKPVISGPWVTFAAEEANSSIGLYKKSNFQTLEYSTDTTTWSKMSSSTTITLANIGDKVYIRGVLSRNNSSSNYTRFTMSGKIAASGNCNALWNYEDLNAPLKSYCGYYMFEYCRSLITAPELPAMELAPGCYRSMFSECSSLTVAPVLPATKLTNNCYRNMFEGCTNLTTAPELPATELVDYCYAYMFDGCSSLITAPELPATTLSADCYRNMFSGCTSLTAAPELPATTLADSCYYGMFNGCSSLTTAPELPATELADYCYAYMFDGCSSLITAPELPATTLAGGCYFSMFNSCTNLNYIKCLATDISASYCTESWVSGAASAGTFIKHPNMTSWTTGISGIPSGWTVVDAEV